MSATAAGLLQLLLLVALLALAHRPLGDYMARVFTGSRHLGVERAFYRVVRVDPDADHDADRGEAKARRRRGLTDQAGGDRSRRR